ncbi:MAG: DEAD/DEAH box helicase family protein [candidate division WOR-3 bacterium]|nr:DEAD/DEAH box helicase family protein [candidate division WOR-3 bacterium]
MKSQVVIENPVINSPYAEPTRHFKFNDEGITDEIAEGLRRESAYFVPIARPRKRSKQLSIETEWTQDRIEPNRLVNQIRERVGVWRKGNYRDVTRTTARLLEYWQRKDRERRLFFCQIEALETAIYLTEVADRYGDAWIENELRTANEEANPKLNRMACKMATGSGKTVVMAMLIAWHVLNKLANPQDARFSDTFLVVTPGITIRDRLRVLLPNDSDNYYAKFDLAPSDDLSELGKARIVITNFHGFQLRERTAAGKLTKAILKQGESSPFTETPDQMVRRVCRELGNKQNIIVINDEAHHCYRRKVEDVPEDKLVGDERKEAEQREKEARIWISGLEAVKAKLGIKVIYDLSATPFFLRGSGYAEGLLFKWVVSDFSLIDAIESGIVKVPRVPVSDDSMTGEQPTYRDIWLRIRDKLPKKGRKTGAVATGVNLPVELEGALQALYGNYEKYFAKWEANTEARAHGSTPPVFIVVCNNTNVSKLVYDYVAGWEKELEGDATALVPGKLSLFSNVLGGRWLSKPNTILIDSSQLESGEAMSDDFKKMAAVEIEEFKDECRRRFPGRDVEKLTDEDLLREVMNTVGKPGKLGEHVRCVISVSILTEGWDANTVTHVLGVRAFGTQLLCEQVVGRGLRRSDYTPEPDGLFAPQYAEVFGVPFSFIPCSGSSVDPKPGRTPTHVRALEARIACEITFPRLIGYRYVLPEERLEAWFTEDSRYSLSTRETPTETDNCPIVGDHAMITFDHLKERRGQEVEFSLAKLVLEKYCLDEKDNLKPWLFPQVLRLVRQWLAECVTYKDNTFPQMLLIERYAHDAADRIYQAIVATTHGQKTLRAILRPYDWLGSTRFVSFDTTRDTYQTRADRCHVSHVVADTASWEQKMAQALEDMDEVVAYVKNQNFGFDIPYTIDGEEHWYRPDFLVRIRVPSPGRPVIPSERSESRNLSDASGEILNLIVEVSGEPRRDKAAKVATARNLWIPAVNNDGRFGRWAFIEVTDPWDAKNTIRAAIDGLPAADTI